MPRLVQKVSFINRFHCTCTHAHNYIQLVSQARLLTSGPVEGEYGHHHTTVRIQIVHRMMTRLFGGQLVRLA